MSGYFGPGEPRPDDEAVVPFRIDVPDSVLEDLRRRLETARISHEPLEDCADFAYGFNLPTLRRFRDHWLHKYDWRRAEKHMNRLPHFRTQIEGLQLHFVHVRPTAPFRYRRVLPILLAHGWPGSFFEFDRIIPLLTDPDDPDLAFEVVCPSIPGYGFSEAPHKTGEMLGRACSLNLVANLT